LTSCKQARSLWFPVAGLIFITSTALAAEQDPVPAPHERSSTSTQTCDFWDLSRLDLNVYGLSYHPDRNAVHRKNLDNQVNPGLALHYSLTDSARGTSFVEGGAYLDSGRNWAKFAGLGYQYKVGERWKIGGAVAVANSPTYNRGATFVGMIPLITYDLGLIKLNAVYFPKIGNYNQVDAFGFYVSLPFGAWR